jgi:DDE family transposase
LVTNMASAEEACRLYTKRFRIETFFSDQKSRGFHLQKSHLSDPQRLSRLLIAACLAYIWIVYLGSVCMKERWVNMGCLKLPSRGQFLCPGFGPH